MPLLEGKNALIFGIANHRSIGWAIAQALAGEGAHLAFTYQDRMEKYVRDLAPKFPIPRCFHVMCRMMSNSTQLSPGLMRPLVVKSTF